MGSCRIGSTRPLFIIAEAGVNHNGDIGMAKELVDVAKECGADAVKFQTFSADALVTSTAPTAVYQRRATGVSTQYDVLNALEFDKSEWRHLANHAKKKGILFLSTPFDEKSADLVDSLGVHAFKISSGDVTNDPLLAHIARKGKPVILSTGMSTMSEISHALLTLRSHGNPPIILLHCVSSYPAPIKEANVQVVQTLSRAFGVLAGFSDHTLGLSASSAAVALGACVIEKHITLDKTLEGPDHKASADPEEFASFVSTLRQVHEALGSQEKAVTSAEKEIRLKARRSIIAAFDLPAGTLLTRAHLAVKRPGTGMPPTQLHTLIGCRLVRSVKKDQLIFPADVGA